MATIGESSAVRRQRRVQRKARTREIRLAQRLLEARRRQALRQTAEPRRLAVSQERLRRYAKKLARDFPFSRGYMRSSEAEKQNTGRGGFRMTRFLIAELLKPLNKAKRNQATVALARAFSYREELENVRFHSARVPFTETEARRFAQALGREGLERLEKEFADLRTWWLKGDFVPGADLIEALPEDRAWLDPWIHNLKWAFINTYRLIDAAKHCL